MRTGGTIYSYEDVDCGHEMNQENRKIIASTVFDVLKASIEEEEVTTVVSLDEPPKSFLSYASAPAPAAQDQEVVAALRRAREREELEKSMAAALDAEDSARVDGPTRGGRIVVLVVRRGVRRLGRLV